MQIQLEDFLKVSERDYLVEIEKFAIQFDSWVGRSTQSSGCCIIEKFSPGNVQCYNALASDLTLRAAWGCWLFTEEESRLTHE